MTTLFANPVAYWTEAAAAHREHAERYGRDVNHKALHETLAVECEMRAAEAVAERAFGK